MSKKTRTTLIIILGPFLAAFLVYYTFLGIEYFSGKEYVEYLDSNSETLALDEPFSYSIASEDFENSKLILVGEIHGTNVSTGFDVELFSHLYHNYDVRWYWAELDVAQAYMMNEFLKSGDQVLLEDILEHWVVAQGRNNQDYIDKYMNLHRFYSSLPENEKFNIIGIDKVQDWRFLTRTTNLISEVNSELPALVFDKEKILSQLEERINILDSLNIADTAKAYLVKELKRNIQFYREKVPRETVMFRNFEESYTYHSLQDERTYGFFGLYHVFQYEVDDEKPLAALIRSSDLGLEDKMISINFMLVDSKMVMKSNALPGFLQDDGPYTKMGLSSDNVIVLYIYGIQDFKRMTPAHHKSFIKMNGSDSPYENSKRLNTTIQILPVTDIFRMTEKGQEYLQYTVFVRNSDWAAPKQISE